MLVVAAIPKLASRHRSDIDRKSQRSSAAILFRRTNSDLPNKRRSHTLAPEAVALSVGQSMAQTPSAKRRVLTSSGNLTQTAHGQYFALAIRKALPGSDLIVQSIQYAWTMTARPDPLCPSALSILEPPQPKSQPKQQSNKTKR